jgi:hypothetical protein
MGGGFGRQRRFWVDVRRIEPRIKNKDDDDGASV